MFISMFRDFAISDLWNGGIFELGMSRADLAAIAAGCIAVAVIGSVKERGIDIRESLAQKPVFLRWGLYYALILAVVVIARVRGTDIRRWI